MDNPFLRPIEPSDLLAQCEQPWSAFDWSSDQQMALCKFLQWYHYGNKQVFRLNGYAGTGKTTLIVEIARRIPGTVLFMTFTGKAASVLSAKAGVDARTIHSQLYEADEDGNGKLHFGYRPSPAAQAANLIIIDEVSMVGLQLGKDLLRLGKKILVVGDPGQLPPIDGAGFFTREPADVTLEQIHRQAENDPIVRMAATVRAGGGLKLGSYGESKVVTLKSLDADTLVHADQILVGRNTRRRDVNHRMRQILGFSGADPEVGDKLVCLRNNAAKGPLNGTLWRVEAVARKPTSFAMKIRSEDTDHVVQVDVPGEFFGARDEISAAASKAVDQFTYGYALTVHKSQGSQWDNVVLFDEALGDKPGRWRYTGITRAAKRITVVKLGSS